METSGLALSSLDFFCRAVKSLALMFAISTAVAYSEEPKLDEALRTELIRGIAVRSTHSSKCLLAASFGFIGENL